MSNEGTKHTFGGYIEAKLAAQQVKAGYILYYQH